MMKQWLQSVWQNKSVTKNIVTKNTVTTNDAPAAMWQDMGVVYYLFDTLKLNFTSRHGDITIENLTEKGLIKLLNELSCPNNPLTPCTEKTPQIPLEVSLCGVGFESHQGQRRAKAINQAASIRFYDSQLCNSQATYQHQHLAYDDAISPLVQHSEGKSLHRVCGVSLHYFLAQLRLANKLLHKKGFRHPPIKADNFKAPLTKRDKQLLNY